MITLHSSPATAGMVVHWLLLELDVPHALHMLDLDAREHKQPAYLALNPAGVVPTLEIDGQPICEAAAIALHLADAYPAGGFAPAAGTLARAAYYRWMFFLANTVQPAFRAWFNPTEAAGDDHIAAVKAKAEARLADAWTILDAHLAANGPYVLGDRVTTPDFMLTMLMRWSRHFPRTALEWPMLARLATAMKSRPTFKELYARERLTEWT
jgi:glutathione S-transferase